MNKEIRFTAHRSRARGSPLMDGSVQLVNLAHSLGQMTAAWSGLDLGTDLESVAATIGLRMTRLKGTLLVHWN